MTENFVRVLIGFSLGCLLAATLGAPSPPLWWAVPTGVSLALVAVSASLKPARPEESSDDR